MTIAPMATTRWTDSDIDALPCGGPRQEILDGSLYVTPRPTPFHAHAVRLITNALEETAEPGWMAYFETEVRFGPDNDRGSLSPDVMVAPRELLRHHDITYVKPEQIRLVVEVVSPGSRRADRLIKPIDYARLGIPSYWRVELLGAVPSLVEYQLDKTGLLYEITQTAEGTFSTDQPWPITIDVYSLGHPY